MKIFKSPEEMKSFRQENFNVDIGFIPTMGALHQGHISLVNESVQNNDLTVVSIYVNETQFNDPNDLANYPSSIEEDIELLKKSHVDAVFMPTYDNMYGDGFRYKIVENQESLDRCGKDRPGHFDGVLTIVMKLLNIIKPQRAYFGEKDFQQLSLIQGMAESFFLETEIIGCPTERDEQGLALSSRNRKLNEEEIKKAHFFAKQLKTESDLSNLKSQLVFEGIDVDYLVEKSGRRFAAVKINNVRLIDNVQI